MTASVPSSSGDVLADRRFVYASAAAAEGDHAAAADLLTQTLERVPDWAPAWFALGCAHAALAEGDPLDVAHPRNAARAFREALARDPEDRAGASLHLSRLTGERAPAATPAYVAGLFDQYASRFDRHLTEQLGYRGPAVLRQAVEGACGTNDRPVGFSVMLDLGCGTGLAGAAFRDIVSELAGVDLSGAMLDQARTRGIYDRLVRADVVAFLGSEPAGGADLIVAADMVVYLGDLSALFRAAARAIAPGGLFALTGQVREEDGFGVGEDLRFGHSAAYLVEASRGAGWRALRRDEVSMRRDRGRDVPGWVVVLQRA